MTATVEEHDLWMRPVSFSGLHRILHLVAEYPNGITPGNLDSAIRERELYTTEKGNQPSRTTLYHCRNTLLRLGLLRRDDKRILIKGTLDESGKLLREPPELSLTPRRTVRKEFARCVLNNEDCRTAFFDLFLKDYGDDPLSAFRRHARPVHWNPDADDRRERRAILESDHFGERKVLRTPVEFKAILYGVRYWARDELYLIDEFVDTQSKVQLYPVRDISAEVGRSVCLEEMASIREPACEWTSFSLRKLIKTCGVGHRLRKQMVFETVKWLNSRHHGYVQMITTSPSMATLGEGNPQRRDLALSDYPKDSEGCYISHVRVHNDVWETIE